MKTRVLSMFLVLVVAMMATTASAADPGDFVIDSKAALYAFAELVNTEEETFKGKTVYLTKDIDLGGETWTPIGTSTVCFQGEFDGQGHTIRNFKLDATKSNDRVGFFRNLDVATANQPEHQKVHDLTLADVTAEVSNNARLGVLAYGIYGEYYSEEAKVEDVTVENVTITVEDSAGSWIGGMCGWTDSGVNMTDCTVSNLTITTDATGAERVGGFAAIMNVTFYSAADTDSAFDGCVVDGFKLDISAPSGGCAVAGFAQQTQINSRSFTFTDCKVKGLDITASGNVEAAGFIVSPGGISVVRGCSVEGMIDVREATEGYAGGFYGNFGWGVAATQQIIDCETNVAILTNTVPAGGLIGISTDGNGQDKNGEFENCTVNGTVVSTGDAPVGALAGTGDRGNYIDCTINGSVVGNSADGLVGKEDDDSTITEVNCTPGTTIKPNGEVTIDKENNTVTVPAGSTVTNPDGTKETLTEEKEVGLGGQSMPELGYGVLLLPSVMFADSELLETTFDDVSRGAYYYKATKWAYENGIAGGVDVKHFAPDESCTRAQAVTMMWRAAGCPETTAENPFEDVSANDYFYEAVLWAVANGITSGSDETHFSPDSPCTRGQIVTFLHRAERCYGAHESFGFVDVKTGSYCEDAINWAVENGITNGTDVGAFSPEAVCTRAQIVTFLYRNR